MYLFMIVCAVVLFILLCTVLYVLYENYYSTEALSQKIPTIEEQRRLEGFNLGSTGWVKVPPTYYVFFIICRKCPEGVLAVTSNRIGIDRGYWDLSADDIYIQDFLGEL